MRTAAICLVVLLTLACTLGDYAASDDAVPPGTPIAIEETPRLVVGEVAGDPHHELYQVRSPFLLPGGGLAVPLAGESSIRLYGPDGEFMEALGQPGEGPGEFAALGAAWARGDTIEAFDGRLLRVTRFLSDGSVETVPLEPAWSAQIALPEPLSDGWVVFGAAVNPGMTGRDEVVLHRYASDGSHRGEIGRTGGFSRYRFSGGGGAPEPLSPRAVVAVHADEVYVAETLTPRIAVLDPAGTPVREVAWDPGEARSSARIFQEVADAAAELDGGTGFTAPEVLAQANVPERVSAFWDFLVDAEGFVWIRPFEPLRHAAVLGGLSRGAGPGGEWVVLTPGGEEVGRIRMPDGFQPSRIGPDVVVGVYRDEWDVESVRVYPLRRGE